MNSLRKCLYFIPPNRRPRWIGLVALAVAVSVVEAVGALLVYVVLRMLTDVEDALDLPLVGDLRDRFPSLDDQELLAATAIVIALFFVLRALLVITQYYLQNRTTHGAGVELSERLLDGYLHMPYEFHLRRTSAEVIRNTYQAVNDLVTHVFNPVVALTSEAILVIGILVVLLVMEPVPTLLALLLMGPVVFAVLRVLQPRIARMGSVHQAMASACLEGLQQALQGLRDIRVLGRESWFRARYVRDYAKQARMLYTVRTLVDAPRLVLETVLLVGILAFVAVSALRGNSTTGSLTTLGLFGYAVVRIMPALNRVVANLNLARYGGSAVDHIYDDLTFLENARPLVTSPTSAPPIQLTEEIRLDRVGFVYPGTTTKVLTDVSLSIRKGESVGIVGPTGSGKSTLVDLLIGLLSPTEGKVTVDGRDIGEDSSGWLHQVGVVHQTIYLFNDTLARNVALGFDDEEIDRERLTEAIELAQLTELVATLPDGVDAQVGERGILLSGGQRQRVAIARAVYRHPQVLVFDEGTSALDRLTESRIVETLRDRGLGQTIITVAHRISTVREADRLFVLKDGRLCASGSYEHLIDTSAEFRQLTG